MKALSLWQPHSSLVALGLKGVETRGRATHYRGPLLVHAAVRWTLGQRDCLASLRKAFPEIASLFPGGPKPWSPPACPALGAVVAVAQLVDCRLMTAEWVAEQSPLERAVGDWTPGRFGLVLADVRVLTPEIPLKGRQGLFDVVEGDVGPAYWARLQDLARA